MDYRELLAGVVGAVFNTYVGHPFDTIRVRMQNLKNIHNSSLNCLKSTYSGEGMRGIYRGATSSLQGLVAENSIVFATNEYLKQTIYGVDRKTPLSFTQDMFVGSMSGFASTVASCPFETIKCNIQVQTEKKVSALSLYKKYKLRGLYSGFGASCARNIPYYLLFFPIFNTYSQYISNYTDQSIHSMGLVSCALAGGLAGATSWSIIYPLDVIKCNQQIALDSKNRNIRETFIKIYKTNGVRSFYAGFGPTILRAFPANSALLIGVELTNRYLDKDSELNT